MDINNKARTHWACRSGMRELDISIMPFFEYEYDTLSDADKQLFIRLLENDDPDLFNWLMNHGKPADAELQRMVISSYPRPHTARLPSRPFPHPPCSCWWRR